MEPLSKSITLFRIISYIFLYCIVLNVIKSMFEIRHLLMELMLGLPGTIAIVLCPIGLYFFFKGDWKSLPTSRKILYLGGYLFYNFVGLLMILSFVFVLLTRNQSR